MKGCRVRFGQAIVLAFIVAPMLWAGNDLNYKYLALGDSVSYGYDPTIPLSQPPKKYVGYPEIIGDLLRPNDEVNASCPGQSSASFLDTAVPDIGCQAFKAAIGLHTKYSGSQFQFAAEQLASNKNIELVTLSIGGDDLLLLQAQCVSAPDFAQCVLAALPAVLGSYGENLTQILTGIRNTANYHGDLVLVKYYSPSTDPLFIQAIVALNAAMTQVGTAFGAKFADGFTAFQIASIPFQGDPCKAGLLVRLTPTTCDVHASRLGQNVLAVTVLAAAAGR